MTGSGGVIGGTDGGGPSAAGGSPSTSTKINGIGGSTGVTGIGGTPAASIDLDSFDNLVQMQVFTPQPFPLTDCSVNVDAANDAGASFLLQWSGSVDVNADSATPGSMKVTATFTNWDQWWEVEMNGPADSLGNPLNLTNKLITAQIKIIQGTSSNPNYPFVARIFLKTGSGYVWGSSPFTNISALNTWYRLVLDTAAPDGVPIGQTFDPTQPKQLGVTLNTGGAGESTYCSQNYAVPFGLPMLTIAYIDQIQVEPRP